MSELADNHNLPCYQIVFSFDVHRISTFGKIRQVKGISIVTFTNPAQNNMAGKIGKLNIHRSVPGRIRLKHEYAFGRIWVNPDSLQVSFFNGDF